MGDPARRKLTYADLLALDDNRAELLDGEIVHDVSPRGLHGRAQARFARQIGGVDLDDPDAGGWWIITEPDWAIDAHTVVRPDLAGWRRERLPEIPDGAFELAPDWVCELVSSKHAARDLRDKAELYRREGVAWYWLGFPEAGTLSCWQLVDGRWVVVGTWARGQKARIPPFEEVEVDLDGIFLPQRR